MPSFDTSNPAGVFITVLGLIAILGFIISVHEAAHAFVANKLGDPTAKMMGRITLNPAAHIDPIGTVLVPLILLLIGGLIFGWAKPTPINPLNFENPRRDSAITAAAGPASNFLMALAGAVVFRVVSLGPNTIILDLLFIFIILNLVLGIFNLLPVPPLDGFKVLIGVLPKQAALQLSVLESYGPLVLILFLLLFFQFFSGVIFSLLNFFLNILVGTTL